MSKKRSSSPQKRNVIKSGNPAINGQPKPKTNPVKSGNPAVKAAAVNNPTQDLTLGGTTWKEKIVLSLLFTAGSFATFFAMDAVRPPEGRMHTFISNVMFSTSGGFLAILLLALIVNAVRSEGPRLSAQGFRKTVSLAIVIALALTGALAAFSSTTPDNSVDPNTPTYQLPTDE